ncbi:ATP-binding protein [Candidatus Woesearchaeota archaeon]|nr:ATP-binding protein [Candidatus Woesearchaeota archaeon]
MIPTLETITAELKRKGVTDEQIENKIHTASMLALVQAARSVMSEECMPTPLYRLLYDETSHHLQFQSLEGRAAIPNAQALDVSMLDMLLAATFREKMPLLWEGKTGIGKTFTTEKLGKTLFAPENYRVLRLNQTMSNVQQPYVEGRIENGVVKIFLRKDELERIALLFIDEVNRGDSNQVLQIQDGQIALSTGERGELGLPVPHYTNGAWTLDRESRKGVQVVSAQNPPATTDAKYNKTTRNDAAMSNRNLTLNVPNPMGSIGASVVFLSSGNGQHKKFMDRYTSLLAQYAGVSPDKLTNVNADWLNVYAFTTNPKKTEQANIRSAVEFLDGMLLLTSPDLEKVYEQERGLSQQWKEALRAYNVDFEYPQALTPTANILEKVREIVQSFEEEVITRDITKVRKLADAVSTIRKHKQALDSPTPVQAYAALPKSVEGFAEKIGYTWKRKLGLEGSTEENKFTPDNPNLSIYALALTHALQETGKAKKDKVATFVEDLATSVALLKRQSVGDEIRKPLLARYIADLATLAGFADQYKTELEQKLTAKSELSTLKGFYREVRMRGTIDDIYLQRLPRVLAVE